MDVVLENGEDCWIGVRRDGNRKAGGMWWLLLGCSSRRTVGRMAIEVDIVY